MNFGGPSIGYLQARRDGVSQPARLAVAAGH